MPLFSLSDKTNQLMEAALELFQLWPIEKVHKMLETFHANGGIFVDKERVRILIPQIYLLGYKLQFSDEVTKPEITELKPTPSELLR